MGNESMEVEGGRPEGYGTQEPLETLVMSPTETENGEGSEREPGMAEPPAEAREGGRRRIPMVMGGVAALALVAGLGLWAPWGGGTPAGEAETETTTEAEEPGEASDGQAAAATLSFDITTSDVDRAVRGLTLLGTDVSVADGSAKVFVHDGDVLVTQVTSDSEKDCIGMVARRAAALSAELGDRCASVTWVEAGGDGIVRAAVRMPAAAAAASASWEDALKCADGWAVSEAVAKAAGVSQAHGVVPSSLANKEIVPGVAAIDTSSGRLDPAPRGQADADEAAKKDGDEASTKTDASAAASATSSTSSRVSKESADAADAQQSGTRQAAEGSGSPSRAKDTSQQQPSAGQTQDQRQRTWVPEQGHYEDVYESQQVKTGQRWVEDSAAWDEQVPDGERIVCSDGTVWYDMGSCDAHMEEVALNGGSISYKVETEYKTVHHDATGHYEDVYGTQQVKTGQRWVVDVPGHWE